MWIYLYICLFSNRTICISPQYLRWDVFYDSDWFIALNPQSVPLTFPLQWNNRLLLGDNKHPSSIQSQG